MWNRKTVIFNRSSFTQAGRVLNRLLLKHFLILTNIIRNDALTYYSAFETILFYHLVRCDETKEEDFKFAK